MKLRPKDPSSLSLAWQALFQVLNGKISFGDSHGSDNIDGVMITAAFTVGANSDQTFTHNLGRVPVGYIVLSKSAAGDVYTGSVSATATQITLRNTSTSVTDVLFII